MKVLSPAQLAAFFHGLGQTYQVLVPIRLTDGSRALGAPGDGPLALHGGPLPGKPTAAFFPHQEAVFSAGAAGPQAPAPQERPLFVAGFTPRDLACLRFIDRFFEEGWRDDLYFRRRQGAVVAGVAGYCGAQGALLAPAGGDCDLELIWDKEQWLVRGYSAAGQELLAALPEAASDTAWEELHRAAAQLPQSEQQLQRAASELLLANRVPDAFWAEIGERCIACTGCNLACPTCTCFGVQDWRSPAGVERSRMWDSCQLDGFMREASGHNPLGSEALRTRRRIHHKLAADPLRWGEISCFLCGRCDAVCPTGIGIVAVMQLMVARFG